MVKVAFVGRDVCIGCNVCQTVCPEVFIVKEDPEHDGMLKSFTNDEVDQVPIEKKVQEAIDMCPVQCISWRDAKAGNISSTSAEEQPHKPSHHEEKQAVSTEQK